MDRSDEVAVFRAVFDGIFIDRPTMFYCWTINYSPDDDQPGTGMEWILGTVHDGMESS